MDIDNYVLHATREGVRIRLRGKFNFHSRKAFNTACLEALNHRESRIIALDMADIEYLDSAALGMLLLFRDKTIQAGKEIVLRRPRGEVLEILQIVNFDRLFRIE
jgi:HptB-dependent secretion and biofilm anti anti-sigma factor